MNKIVRLCQLQKLSYKNYLRCFVTNSILYDQKSTIQNSQFVPVYKFPYIRVCSLVNRVKMYQSLVVVGASPILFVLNKFQLISTDTAIFTTYLGFTLCITMYTIGFLLQNFVGIIYYNENDKLAKISYVDFWGRRKNIEIPTSDLIPLSDLPLNEQDRFYLKLRRFSNNDVLKINLKYGIVLDNKKFKKVL